MNYPNSNYNQVNVKTAEEHDSVLHEILNARQAVEDNASAIQSDLAKIAAEAAGETKVASEETMTPEQAIQYVLGLEGGEAFLKQASDEGAAQAEAEINAAVSGEKKNDSDKVAEEEPERPSFKDMLAMQYLGDTDKVDDLIAYKKHKEEEVAKQHLGKRMLVHALAGGAVGAAYGGVVGHSMASEGEKLKGALTGASLGGFGGTYLGGLMGHATGVHARLHPAVYKAMQKHYGE